jgi:hypothetical protein
MHYSKRVNSLGYTPISGQLLKKKSTFILGRGGDFQDVCVNFFQLCVY